MTRPRSSPSLGVALDKKVDPELLRQLKERPTQVAAVFMLRPAAGGQGLWRPEVVENKVAGVLRDVGEATGEEPEEVNVFANLASFVVVATARFIEALIDHPSIASATANRQPA